MSELRAAFPVTSGLPLARSAAAGMVAVSSTPVTPRLQVVVDGTKISAKLNNL